MSNVTVAGMAEGSSMELIEQRCILSYIFLFNNNNWPKHVAD
jgi:hypothetical protein